MKPFHSQTSKEFFEAVETFRLYKRGSLKSIALAAGYHLKSGTCLRSEVAPCLAAIEASSREAPPTFLRRLTWRGIVWFLRSIVYRNRPMWNDYYMALWQLTRKPAAVEDLRRHLMSASAPMVIETAAWMIRSVCEQDSEFARLWLGDGEEVEVQ